MFSAVSTVQMRNRAAVFFDDSTDWLLHLGLWLGTLDVASRLDGQYLCSSRWIMWSPLAGLTLTMAIHHAHHGPAKYNHKHDQVYQMAKFVPLLPLWSLTFELDIALGLAAALAVLVCAVRVCWACTIKRPAGFALCALRLTAVWLSVLVVSTFHSYRPNTFEFSALAMFLAKVVALLLVGIWFFWRDLTPPHTDSFKHTAPASILLFVLALTASAQYNLLVQRMHAQLGVWQLSELGWSLKLNESVTLVASTQEYLDDDLFFEARAGYSSGHPSVADAHHPLSSEGESLTVAGWSKRHEGPAQPDVLLLPHSENPCALAHAAGRELPRLRALLFSAPMPPPVENAAPPEHVMRAQRKTAASGEHVMLSQMEGAVPPEHVMRSQTEKKRLCVSFSPGPTSSRSRLDRALSKMRVRRT